MAIKTTYFSKLPKSAGSYIRVMNGSVNNRINILKPSEIERLEISAIFFLERINLIYKKDVLINYFLQMDDTHL